MEKKTWETPELTILVRGKPEEAVLLACKQTAVVTGPAVGADFTCDLVGLCAECDAIVTS